MKIIVRRHIQKDKLLQDLLIKSLAEMIEILLKKQEKRSIVACPSVISDS